MTHYILKKDWLKYAKSAKKSADSWRKGVKGWLQHKCDAEADAYMKNYHEYMSRSETAPVKIVLHFADGRIQTVE